ncbi:MAG: hypothetical protein U1F06_02950 [Steroidobacteraceae bacterium]
MQDLDSSAMMRRLVTALLLAGLLLLGFQVLRPFIVPAIWPASSASSPGRATCA